MSQNQPAPIDDFLADIQQHLISTVPQRFTEFEAQQSADFPGGRNFSEILSPLLKDFIKDVLSAELNDWAQYLQTIVDQISNDTFIAIWPDADTQVKTDKWNEFKQILNEIVSKFKPGIPSDFSKIPFQNIEAKIKAVESESPSTESDTAPIQSESRPVIQDDLFLMCHIGHRNFAVPIYQVTEIQRYKKISPIPDRPAEVLGLISNRGEIFPILSLHELHIGEVDEKHSYIVICEQRQHKFGFIVSSTDQVVRLDRSKFESAKNVMGGVSTKYINDFTVIDKNIYLILEPEKMTA